MTESSPVSSAGLPAGALAKEGAVLYGSAKAEDPRAPKQESPIVSGVRKAVDKWLERIGPKGVENRFIKAHENVLATLNSDQRKEVFAKEAATWRKIGKVVGIVSTAVDFVIIGMGVKNTMYNLKTPALSDLRLRYNISDASFYANEHWYKKAQANILTQVYTGLYGHAPDQIYGGTIPTDISLTPRELMGDRIASSGPALRSLLYLVGMGPAHIASHGTAILLEKLGKLDARAKNYVDSGKAAEHAAKVGNALGKAATETAKYVAEHPDEIRKTVEAVSKAKRENAESAQKIAQAKQKAADAKLDAEYQDWVMHHPDKTYYEQSGQPYPSKAEYVDMKAREAAAKQANKEAEERGVAKK